MRFATMLGIFLALLAAIFALTGQGGNTPFLLLAAGTMAIGIGNIYSV